MARGGHFNRLIRIAVAVAVLVWIAPASIHGQRGRGAGAPAEPAGPPPPKLPWGEPDLQGAWQHDDTPAQAVDPDPAGREALIKARAARYNPGGAREGTGEPDAYKPLVVDPPDGRFPVLPGKFFLFDPIPRGDNWKNHFVGERCITKGVPDMYLRGDVYRIVQSPGWVVMLNEFIHDVREIPTDGRAHVGSDIRFWNGDPRGRWEGDTLVVDSTNFNDKGQLFAELGGGIKQTSQEKILEKWTRTDSKTIKQVMTVDDRGAFSKPWTVEVTHRLQPANFLIVEYACHEGNGHYMTGSLTQGRLRDKQRAEGGAPASKTAN